jgi:RimJ/RimL family protein N-acetyltransferase
MIKVNENIILKPISEKDTEFIIESRNEKDIYLTSFSNFPFYDFQHKKWLNNASNTLDYIIYYNNEKSGRINISNIDFQNQKGEYGIFITKKYRGLGIAFKASKALIGFTFSNLNINKIYLKVFSDNIKAIKLYEKLGFEKEGILKKEIYKNGEFKDVVIMAIFKEKWEKENENNI